jgi:hypothetical protein
LRNFYLTLINTGFTLLIYGFNKFMQIHRCIGRFLR